MAASLTMAEAQLGLRLDEAAQMRRMAQDEQELALFLCLNCRGPNGRCAGSCVFQEAYRG